MNEIVSKFLLVGDKFIPEMHLRQPGFTYSAYGSFTKNKERIQRFKETEVVSYIYKNELDKEINHLKLRVIKNMSYKISFLIKSHKGVVVTLPLLCIVLCLLLRN